MQRFDPPTSPARQALAAVLFVLLLGATTAFLWTAHTLPMAQQIAAALGIVGGLWVVGALCDGRRPAAVSAAGA